jgi:hypothetical protein
MNTIEVSSNPSWKDRTVFERRALLFAERQMSSLSADHVSVVAFAWGLKKALRELSLVQVDWLDDVSLSTLLEKMAPAIPIVTNGRLPTTPMLKRFRDDADRVATAWGHRRTIYVHWFYALAEHLDLYSVIDCAEEFKRKIRASIPCPTEYFPDWVATKLKSD